MCLLGINFVTRYRSNASMGPTGHGGQNIPGTRDLLINEKNVFVNAIACTFKTKNKDNSYSYKKTNTWLSFHMRPVLP